MARRGDPNRAAQLRADTRTLANEILASANVRLLKLAADEQAKAAARAALDAAGAALDLAKTRKEATPRGATD